MIEGKTWRFKRGNKLSTKCHMRYETARNSWFADYKHVADDDVDVVQVVAACCLCWWWWWWCTIELLWIPIVFSTSTFIPLWINYVQPKRMNYKPDWLNDSLTHSHSFITIRVNEIRSWFDITKNHRYTQIAMCCQTWCNLARVKLKGCVHVFQRNSSSSFYDPHPIHMSLYLPSMLRRRFPSM